MASFFGLQIGSFQTIFFVGLVLAFHVVILVEGERDIPSRLSEEEDLELERQLNILNKSPIKTIHTGWGDIYDCIEFHKQPAFDHPLLKNRTITIPKIDEPVSTRSHKTLMSQIEGCPKRTVPIRRTTKEDLIRAKHLSSSSNTAGDEYFAGMTVQQKGERYFGASGLANVWNPKVNTDQSSGAEIQLIAGPIEHANYIIFGWTVDPRLYGDNATRTFTYWSSDSGYTTGCYNTLCPGFVQVHPTHTPFLHFNKTSVIAGEQIHLLSSIHMDAETGDWWLIMNQTIKVGYWPKDLFTQFQLGAEYIYWGGRVRSGKDGIAPEMASGSKLDDFPNHVGYYAALNYTNEVGGDWIPLQKGQISVDCKGSYDASLKYSEDHVLMYGGPGGPCV
ncbi:hypothetical protein MKW92_001888 [Papaver armeniacum]|nr:hypothetical protein MKW92_001888 [Papaver armeniacum]